MLIRSRGAARVRRSVAVLALGAVAVLGASAPAGAFQVYSTSGVTGVVSVTDTAGAPGVRCTYRDAASAASEGLERIRTKGFYAHHPSSAKRYVGYRYIVTRQSLGSVVYSSVYTSTEKRQLASSTEATFFGNRDFVFGSPVTNNGARYRIVIQLTYYGSDGTSVVGVLKGRMQVYRHANPGAALYDIGSEGSTGYCKANFHF